MAEGPPPGPATPVGRLLREAAARTGTALRRAVDRLPADVRHLAGLHFGWWDEEGAPPAAGPLPMGKAVRAALVLLSCEALGGERAAAVPAAVSVELVHNASLLHDDVIDGDRIRRGRPALWARCGLPAAVLTGDALFFLAVQVLVEAAAPLSGAGVTQLTTGVQELIDGEYADSGAGGRSPASAAECVATAAAKTGALFAVACGLGALAADASPARVERLRAFGSHAGVAFQLVDDLLGIWGDPRRTGKPARSDLAARRRTLPIAAALADGGPPARELARIYDRRDPLSPAELDRAARLVGEAGGRARTLDEIRRSLDRALHHLAAAGPAPRPAAELTALAHMITRRDR
ncbi:polyprenyl synthetase family protein [Streptomyces huiliensis]|uniref:polyprenyl synthetase family protein n=1 Tax=Streptomyces huiliensis TaxID=2876027 RepID=UPI001CC141E5|nr:polyprenyl synthetase family protein [Streptomyces huiliensis]MBZ4318384.1 polyprenyl synthetase family protein [Streptomyces huiliensis]